MLRPKRPRRAAPARRAATHESGSGPCGRVQRRRRLGGTLTIGHHVEQGLGGIEIAHVDVLALAIGPVALEPAAGWRGGGAGRRHTHSAARKAPAHSACAFCRASSGGSATEQRRPARAGGPPGLPVVEEEAGGAAALQQHCAAVVAHDVALKAAANKPGLSRGGDCGKGVWVGGERVEAWVGGLGGGGGGAGFAQTCPGRQTPALVLHPDRRGCRHSSESDPKSH